MKNFRQIGEISKSQISICKVCEFRRICPDSRVYTVDKTTQYSKPSKCDYDRYTASWIKSVLSLVFFLLLGYVSPAQNGLEISKKYYDSIVYFYHEQIPKYRKSSLDSIVIAEDKAIYFMYKFIDTTKHTALDDDKRKAITWLSDLFSAREFEKSKNLFEYISKYYSHDLRVKRWLLTRLDTTRNFRSKEFLTKYGEELKNILERKSNNENEGLKKTLELVWDNDQAFRKDLVLAKKDGNRVLESQLTDSMLLYDRKNLEIVENVLKNYGWPSPSDIGYKASQAIFLVLHHSDTATFFRYYNEILEAYKSNKIAKEDYELYIDRYRYRKYDYQPNGIQSYYDSILKK